MPHGARLQTIPQLFLCSTHTNPIHLSVIGGAFLLESIVRYAVIVRYPEFGGCLLFGSSKCIVSSGIPVGTSTVVHCTEEVQYWEGSLSEVPLYKNTMEQNLNGRTLMILLSYTGTT